MIKKKNIELALECVPAFPSPKEYLEQYITPSYLASEMLWHAFMSNDIRGKVVYDLGCGTGRLALAAALLEAKYVICVDIDQEALSVAKEALRAYPNTLVDFIATDLRTNSSCLIRKPSLREMCTVIMNPPFGVYSRGADIDYLKVALKLCNVVYSIHKASEGLFKALEGVCKRYRCTYKLLYKAKFPIYWFLNKHRRRKRLVDVVFFRFNRY